MNSKVMYLFFMLMFFNILNITKIDVSGQNTYNFELATLGQLENITDFKLSPNESILAVINNENTVILVDVASLDTLYTFENSRDDVIVNSISWSFDSNFLAVGTTENTQIWGAERGRLVYEFNHHSIQPIEFATEDVTQGTMGVEFSTVDKKLATFNYFDETVILYDMESELITELADHEDGGISTVTFSPLGNYIAVQQIVGGITVWDVNTGEKLLQLPGETFAFNNTETSIATGLGRFHSQIWIWDMETSELLTEYSAPLVASQLYWTSDDQMLFTSLNSARLVDDGLTYTGEGIHGWNITTQELVTILTIDDNYSFPIVLADEETLIGFSSSQTEQNILVWNNTNDEVYTLTPEPETALETYSISLHPLNIIGVSQNDEELITWFDNKIFIWDILHNEVPEYAQILFNTSIRKVVQSPSRSLIIVLTDNYSLTIWAGR